ncbi:MAG: ATP-binding cassette domain-containing protein [Mycobacteriales bacterium]
MILDAHDLTLSYGMRTILRDFSLRLEAGEQCALTGRSGSDKTTLLLVLAGLLRATTGSITWDVARREILYIPQAPSLVPELTAVQNASLGLRVRGVSPAEAEDAARHQLRMLGLQDADQALPAQLSGGMQQRVALARALAVEPALLLADEPTGALDQTTAAMTVGVLKDYAVRTGGALIVATHDPDVAERFPRQLTLNATLHEDVLR